MMLFDLSRHSLALSCTLALLACLPCLLACAQQPRPGGAAAGASTRATAGASTQSSGSTAAPPPGGRDPHSFARPDEVAVEHLRLDLSVDFAARRLSGRASLRLANRTGAGRVLLDTRDLDIQRVTLDDGRAEASFTLGEAVPHLGRPLEIRLAPGTRWVSIDYATHPEAAALQWLTPDQAGSSAPLLYTQSQAILARTWVPCQDTPGVRMTYEATVRVPRGLMAVMSAENPTAQAADGIYRFRMPQRIPSYLLALAVGDLAFRAFDQRSGVYALPQVLDRAAWELAETPRMIDAAERLYGPYRWGRYDLLILPASAPYGGMENPRLTFATPTILAGDRSLVGLVAHELAHSWSGNLVTNATWNDFWLNEGFTVYFERRIMEALHGRDYALMLAVLGRQELDDTVAELGAKSGDTRLALDLAGRDPDEGVSSIAYEKGALLLATIEAAVGRERFDRYLRAYFDRYAFQSMATARFLDDLRSHLLAGSPGLAEALRLEEWIYEPGVPGNAVTFSSAAFAAVDREVDAFARGTAASQLHTAGWITQQWQRFLHRLPTALGAARMRELDAAFHFTDSGNAEILSAWLLLAVENRYAEAYPALDRFLTSVGRRKFLKPLYAALAKTPEGAEMALRIYSRARPLYHPVAQSAIDKILDWRG